MLNFGVMGDDDGGGTRGIGGGAMARLLRRNGTGARRWIWIGLPEEDESVGRRKGET